MEMSWRLRLFGRIYPLLSKPVSRMSREEVYAAQRDGLPDTPLTMQIVGRPARTVTRTDRRIPTRDGDVGARVYTPPRTRAGTPSPVVVNFHGGGWTLGTLDHADWLCSHVAQRVGAVVVSVDYRLAPDHPFPAAVHDCYDATAWVAGHAHELRGVPGSVAVMGDSAGANLATVTSMLARDAGGPRLCQQVLIYPSTDSTLSSPSIARYADAAVITRADIEAYIGHYTGGDPPAAGATRRHPHVSPLLAEDLGGLPPALVQTAEHDPLKDEGRRYAERLEAAGVPVRFTEYVGVPHGFINLPGLTLAAHQALAEICEALTVAFARDTAAHAARLSR